MGRPFLQHLDGRIYCCKMCHCHLAQTDELISKHFHCKNGKAYLFNTVVNVFPGPKEERLMTTGMHVVCDIYCTGCLYNVGWKYEEAYDKTQKYKEGKFILERAKIADARSFDVLSCASGDNSDSDGA